MAESVNIDRTADELPVGGRGICLGYIKDEYTCKTVGVPFMVVQTRFGKYVKFSDEKYPDKYAGYVLYRLLSKEEQKQLDTPIPNIEIEVTTNRT